MFLGLLKKGLTITSHLVRILLQISTSGFVHQELCIEKTNGFSRLTITTITNSFGHLLQSNSGEIDLHDATILI